MKYVKCYVDCNYAGCDETAYVSFNDDITEDEIEDFVTNWAINIADEYKDRCLEGDDDFDSTLEDEYYDNIYFNYEYITEKEYMDNSD